MITIERFFWGHLLVAVAALAVGFAFVPGYGSCSMIVVVLGLVWFIAQQRKAEAIEGLMLFVFGILAGIGFFNNAPAWLMLVSVIATLGAWDLYTFLLRLAIVERVEFASGLGAAHLRRLGLVELIGLVVGMAAMTINLQISFWWVGLLILVAVIGLSRIIVRIRKELE